VTSADWIKLIGIVEGARKWGGDIDGDKLIAGLKKEAADLAQQESEAEQAEEDAYNYAMEGTKP
jgi:hypothetical protein